MLGVDSDDGGPDTEREMPSLKPFDTAAPDLRVDSEMSRDGSLLRLHFHLQGSSLPRITGLWTSPGQPAAEPTEGLWESTCFEAFFGPEDSDVYYELNAAADGRWMVFRFEKERQGRTVRADLRPLSIEAAATADGFDLTVRLDLSNAGELRGTKLRATPSLVLESKDGSRSYWSLKHTPPKPDFHRPDHRVLILPPA